MLAAENGGLPGGKVGGMGDVLRELPPALARCGHRVTVLTPAYGFLARLPGVRRLGSIAVPFAGSTEACDWLEAPSGRPGVDYQLLDHPRFAPGGRERVYHDDTRGGPFATDAEKFAFFAAAAGQLIAGLERPPDVLHLHDWHTALLLLLRGFDPRYRALKPIRCVFTIHNLSLQGTRPLDGEESSLGSWYTDLDFPTEVVADPRHADCVNPLAVGIRLADAVNTVSPSYAEEILVPADEGHGRRGGEGLEQLLAARHREGALSGILNGCDYTEEAQPSPPWATLVALIEEEIMQWIAAGDRVDSGAYLAARRVASMPEAPPPVIATNVGRITGQKLGLFRQSVGQAATAMDRVLAALDPGWLIVLGNGDAEYERFLRQAEARHENLLFLQGYSDRLARMLYAAGDLFLMPSLFEPCGISQMLAMRAGQPCVVHAVGGLKDTVTVTNGFPFDGATSRQQAQNFAQQVAAAVALRRTQPAEWQAIVTAARGARFTWDASAARYLAEVYAFDGDAR